MNVEDSRRVEIEIGKEDVEKILEIVRTVWSQAYLYDPVGGRIEGASLSRIWMCLYRPLPTEKPGEFRLSGLSTYFPLFFSQNQFFTDEAFFGRLTFEEYLNYSYPGKVLEGLSLGISPVAEFLTADGLIQGRCLQLDLDRPPGDCLEISKMMAQRNLVDKRESINTDGFFVASSPKGMHFYGSAYYPCTPEGHLSLADQHGAALLINKAGESSIVDQRQIGHKLRSFSESLQPFPPQSESPETGGLRIAKCLLKPWQPRIIKGVFSVDGEEEPLIRAQSEAEQLQMGQAFFEVAGPIFGRIPNSYEGYMSWLRWIAGQLGDPLEPEDTLIHLTTLYETLEDSSSSDDFRDRLVPLTSEDIRLLADSRSFRLVEGLMRPALKPIIEEFEANEIPTDSPFKELFEVVEELNIWDLCPEGDKTKPGMRLIAIFSIPDPRGYPNKNDAPWNIGWVTEEEFESLNIPKDLLASS